MEHDLDLQLAIGLRVLNNETTLRKKKRDEKREGHPDLSQTSLFCSNDSLNIKSIFWKSLINYLDSSLA